MCAYSYSYYEWVSRLVAARVGDGAAAGDDLNLPYLALVVEKSSTPPIPALAELGFAPPDLDMGFDKKRLRILPPPPFEEASRDPSPREPPPPAGDGERDTGLPEFLWLPDEKIFAPSRKAFPMPVFLSLSFGLVGEAEWPVPPLLADTSDPVGERRAPAPEWSNDDDAVGDRLR